MNVGQFISLGIAVIGLLAGGLGVLKSRAKDITIDTLSQDNTATKDYLKTVEGQRDRAIAERDAAQATVEHIKDMGQGSPQLKTLAGEFTKLTKAVMAQTRASNQQNKLFREAMKVKDG